MGRANLFEKVLSIVGADTLEVFGPSGSGKSTFAYAVMSDALSLGRRVFWLDSERNLAEVPQHENLKYIYTPRFDEIMNWARNLPQADLYVLDSLGYPVLTQFAESSMDEKGRMLLKAVSLTQYFKIASYRYKALVIVTNQPVSVFGKPGVSEQDLSLKPFGDKAVYGYKEIWRTNVAEAKEDRTVCEVRAWRSRRFGRGRLLFRITISDKVSVEPLI